MGGSGSRGLLLEEDSLPRQEAGWSMAGEGGVSRSKGEVRAFMSDFLAICTAPASLHVCGHVQYMLPVSLASYIFSKVCV